SRYEIGERRLAGARRAPEDDARGGGVVGDEAAQRRALSQEMALAHDLVDAPRAHADRERGRRRGRGNTRGFGAHRVEQVHPITLRAASDQAMPPKAPAAVQVPRHGEGRALTHAWALVRL